MFEKEKITIDITSEKISILVGTRYKISYSALIDTPKGSYIKDEIVDIDLIKAAIDGHNGKGKFRTKSKEAYFVVRGDDLIVRHITLPQMKDEAIRDSVEWELTQFVGERADEYNVSYEVVSGKAKDVDNNLDILMVAAEKNKVRKYLELAKALGLQVAGLDIPSNIGARTLRAYQHVFNKTVKSVGIIDVGAQYGSFAIIERGRLQMEKYHGYGIASASPRELLENKDYENFLGRIDLNNEDDFTDGRLQSYFDNISSQFNGIIQFYSSGKVKKTLDKIYLLGTGNTINGIEKIYEDIFNTSVEIIPEIADLKFSVKADKNVSLKDFYYNYGLILKNNKNELNLVPASYNDYESSSKNKKSAIILGIAIMFIIVGGIAGVKGKELYLKLQLESLKQELAQNQALIDKNTKLDMEINLITQHIQKAGEVDTMKSKGTDEVINKLAKNMPSGIRATNISYTKGKIDMVGTAQSQEEIEQMWANLRESKEFKKSHISNIGSNEGKITFNLTISIEGGNNNEQAS